MKAVVFDMDGVLFDTERLCMECWVETAAERDMPDMEQVFPLCIGRNSTDTKQIILEHYGADFSYDDFRQQASGAFWKRIETEGLPVKKGAEKLLAYLKQSGYQIALASSTKYESVVSHLKQAELIDYFSVIVTGDMIEHSKPLPDIYLLACRKLGVQPEEAYAIEDSFNGIRSAYSAGMKAIMVPDMIQPDEEMQEKSFLVCRDLLEVMRFLNH